MATAALPNTITAGTDMVAGEVQGNDEYLEGFVNNEVVHRDGSKAFTALPSAPTDAPTLDGHLLTLGAFKARAGILAKRKHETMTLWVGHDEGVKDMGITLPQFNMPDLSGGLVLRVEVNAPRVVVDSHGGYPEYHAAIKTRLRTSGGGTVAYDCTPIGVTGFTAGTDAHSVSFYRDFHDNAVFPAGTVMNLKLSGELTQNAGKFHFLGDANTPVTMIARLL